MRLQWVRILGIIGLFISHPLFSQEYVELVPCKFTEATCTSLAPSGSSLPEVAFVLAGALVGLPMEASVKSSIKIELLIPDLPPVPLSFELLSAEGDSGGIVVFYEGLNTIKIEYPVLDKDWTEALLLVTLSASDGDHYFGGAAVNEGYDGIQTGNAANSQGRPGSGEGDGPQISGGESEPQARPKFIPSNDSASSANRLSSGSSCGVQARDNSSTWALVILLFVLLLSSRWMTRIQS